MRLGERLLQSGQLTATQLEQGLRAQSALSGRIGTNLIELGFVFADAVSKALAQQKGVPATRRKHFDAADPAVRKLVPRHVAERLGAIPLAMATRFGRELVVAFQDPDDIEAIEEVSRYAGVKVRPSVAPEFYIIEYLDKLYGVPPRRMLRTNMAGRSQPTQVFDVGTSENQSPDGEAQFDLSLPASLAAMSGRQQAQSRHAPASFEPGPPSARQPAAPGPAAQPAPQRSTGSFDLGASVRQAAAPGTAPETAQRPRLATAELDAGWNSSGDFGLEDGDALGSGPSSSPAQAAGQAPTSPAFSAPAPASTPGAFDAFPATKPPEAFEPFPTPKAASELDPFPTPKAASELDPFPTPKAASELNPFPTPKAAAMTPELESQHPAAQGQADGGEPGPTAASAEAEKRTTGAVLAADAPLALMAGEALAAIERAVDRDQVGDALIDYLRNFSAGLVLVCRQGLALGWRGHAPGADVAALEAVSIPLSVPSMFEVAHRQGTPFQGPPPAAGAPIQDRLWKLLHCEPPEEVLVWPIAIGGRIVNLLYAHADDGLPESAAEELVSLSEAAGATYVDLIKQRKN